MALTTHQDIRVQRSGDTIIYRGRLTEQGLDALRNTADSPRVTTLLIESSGGEIVVGMDFGNWVVEHELNVIVDRACLSSCANYVFTAGRRKEIRSGAVVAWHGSAKQPGLLEQLNELVEADIASRGLPPQERQREVRRARRANVKYLTGAIRKQDQFFYRVGVDEYVTRIGNDRYGVRGFFYLSVEDMAEFGIQEVTADKDYADMEPKALAQRIGFPVTLIRLE
ncbi:MAG: hypothetical protein JSW48_12520 [Betaproteobacteria bacterium]|jgi:hypothetical protein|nr:MAG: hypothetical protein JSW48_12520 [Betaproteobacteria bacterium]